ncbi:hypothetical protein Glove_40g37 [Diversispora epigaea]|uniref:Uncharacterized protein n=1 Tax=Diversispora epigaea TaxID=1348612 RepID=A0A397JPK2_9GLOM|nr:hypothetical protein Glove_40g37 [Diversispora epigaea]
MGNTKSELDLLKQENARLMARIAELERTVEEKDELMTRIVELERYKSDTGSDSEISSIPPSTKEYSIDSVSLEKNSGSHPEKIENISDNTSSHEVTASGNSDICQEEAKPRDYNRFCINLKKSKYLKNPKSILGTCIISTSHISAEPKSLEEKEINDFLYEKNKERVSNEIRKRNREKKFQTQDTPSIIIREQKNLQSNSQHEGASIDSTLSRISNSEASAKAHKSEQISIDQKVTRNQMVEQGLIQELTEFIIEESIEIKKSFYLNDKKTVTVQSLVHLYQKASLAEKNTIQAKQEEILCWYYYGKDFEKMVREILSNPLGIGAGCKNNKKANDLARGQIYDEMISHLSGITRENLRKKTQRIIKIYNLFEIIGKDKIKQVRSYSATTISCLTDTNIQNIINSVSKKSHDCETNLFRTYKENLSSDFSLSPKIELEVSENKVGAPPVSKSAVKETSPETKVSEVSISQPKILSEKQNNLKNDHSYIINKVLEQYPNITLRGSSNYFDDYVISASLQDNAYKITDSLSVCPACNQYYRESISGGYREGSYYINCLFNPSEIGIAITA